MPVISEASRGESSRSISNRHWQMAVALVCNACCWGELPDDSKILTEADESIDMDIKLSLLFDQSSIARLVLKGHI